MRKAENISKNIKWYRKDCRLSQGELAEEIGVATSTISAWECYDRTPSIEVLIKIADFFCITLDELVKDKEW